jgi:hypothetical protein
VGLFALFVDRGALWQLLLPGLSSPNRTNF